MSSITFIDTLPSLESLLTILTSLKPSPKPALYMDLEGIHLSRHGSISLISLFFSPTNATYLIDIHALSNTAFTTPTPSHPEKTLKSILEDPSIQKVFFDVRNDSDALFSHFDIHLKGIVDLQLLELGSRPGNIQGKRYVYGLARCIKQDSRLSAVEKEAWESVKDKGSKLFAPEKGGKYEVFNERPLREDLKVYCVQDVALLPVLWEVYMARLGGNGAWKRRIEGETLRRVVDSQGLGYQPNGAHKALGPWTSNV